ncbi:lipid II flippase MurJ [Dermabacter vaginalis]|uniref:lipid II flippase MurJ n=1 Tax=Dermabacter vaginalis TaxID=1630135 RepID=UPI001EF43AA5|nr:lipid II flippase MurJ [Dermabacter vaginalis]MCG7443365.1 hypothetical protein [Dermabacter vaginalis]
MNNSSSSSARGKAMRASAIMAVASASTRLLGFVRTFLLGMVLGGSASIAANAYSAAQILPNSLWILIGGGTLNAILVPAVVRAAKLPDKGEDFCSRLFTLFFVVAVGITTLCTLAVPFLTIVANSKLDPGTLQAATVLGYFMMPQMIFSCIYIMFGQILNAHESFGPFTWAPALNNLMNIAGSILFLVLWGAQPDGTQWTWGMLLVLAFSQVGGSAAQALLVWAWTRKIGLKIRFKWGFRGLGLRKLGTMGLWTFAMMVVGQVAVFARRWSTGGAVSAVEQAQASGAGANRELFPALAALDWSYTVFMLPQGIIAVSLVTSIFPRMSKRVNERDHLGAYRTYSSMNRILFVSMTLATVVLIVLAAPIMWVVVGGTSPVGAGANGLVLIGYTLGLPAFAATYLVTRYFYAYEDTRTAFMMRVPPTVLSLLAIPVILLWVDPRYAAAAGAFASSIGLVIGWLEGVWHMRRNLARQGVDMSQVNSLGTISTIARLFVAGAISTVAGWGLLALFGDFTWRGRIVAIIVGVIVAAVMTGVFALVAWMLRVSEIREAATMISSRLLRKRRGGEPAKKAPAAVEETSSEAEEPRYDGQASDRTTRANQRITVTEIRSLEELFSSLSLSPALEEKESVGSDRLPTSSTEGASWHRGVDENGEPILVFVVRGEFAADVLDAARRVSLVNVPGLEAVRDVLESHEGETNVTAVIYTDPNLPTLADLTREGALRAETARTIAGRVTATLQEARSKGIRHHHLDEDRVFVDLEHDQVTVLGAGIEDAGDEGLLHLTEPFTLSPDVRAVGRILYVGLAGRGPEFFGSDASFDPSTTSPRTVPSDLGTLTATLLTPLTPNAPADGPRPMTIEDVHEELSPWQSLPVTLEAYDPEQHAGAPVPLAERNTSAPVVAGPFEHREQLNAQESGSTDEASVDDATAESSSPVEADHGDSEARAEAPETEEAHDEADAPLTGEAETTDKPVAEAEKPWSEVIDAPKAPSAAHMFPGHIDADAHHAPAALTEEPTAPVAPPVPPAPAPIPVAGREESLAESPRTPNTNDDAHEAPGRPVVAPPSAVQHSAPRVRQTAPDAGVVIPVQGREASALDPHAPAPHSQQHSSAFRDVMDIALASDTAGSSSAAEGNVSRSTTARIILVAALLAVILGLVWAITSVTSVGRHDRDVATNPTTQASEEKATEKTEAPKEEPSEKPTEAPKPLAPLNQVSVVYPPDPAKADKPEDAGRMLDGDPGTVWKTQRYASAEYGHLREGMGVKLDLGDGEVKNVRVTPGAQQGGTIELRALTEDGQIGDVLASGEVAPGEDLTLTPEKPVDARSLVLWAPNLGAVDGGFRLEIAEVKVNQE